jgi:hypothetical protein
LRASSERFVTQTKWTIQFPGQPRILRDAPEWEKKAPFLDTELRKRNLVRESHS